MNNQIMQQALAKLITNPNFCENYYTHRDEIIKTLSLKIEAAHQLDSFYKLNENKFKASARILKKNRWDDIKASLPVTTNFINNELLHSIWENYLSKLGLNDNIPKNPLSESIIFLNFAENHNLLTSIDKQVIRYERIRNEVTYNHHNNFKLYSIVKHDTANIIDSLGKFKIYIHDCFRIESFQYNIPFVLKQGSKDKINCEDTVILFFKNLKKEGIGTIKITSDVRNLIFKTIESNNLSEAYTLFQNKLTPNEFKQLFEKFEHLGVLSIQQVEK